MTDASVRAAPRNLSSTHCLVAATEWTCCHLSASTRRLTKKLVEDIAFKYLELGIVMCDHCGQLIQCLPKLNL